MRPALVDAEMREVGVRECEGLCGRLWKSIPAEGFEVVLRHLVLIDVVDNAGSTIRDQTILGAWITA